MARKRFKLSRRSSRRNFRRTASRVHKRNVQRPMRGGFRI